MRHGMHVAIGRRADAARIDDHPSVVEPHRARQMRVTAEHQPMRDAIGGLRDRLSGGERHRSARSHRFEPIGLVACGRPVTQENALVEETRRRQGAQPFEVTIGQLIVSGPVPGSHLVRRSIDQIAVVVAADADRPALDQEIDGARSVERTAGGVSEIDDLRDALGANVRQHRFEGEIVAVHVGNRREPHVTTQPRCYQLGNVPFSRNTSPAR